MNKKFSTLAVAAMLMSAFSANASVGNPVQKLNSDYLYQLQFVAYGSNAVSGDEVLAVNKDGDLYVKSSATATTDKELGNTLWCASMTQSQDYGQNPIFDFTNKANGFVLDLTVGGYDTWSDGANGFPTKLHVQVGGEVSGWEFSPKVNPLTKECYLASYINGNQAAVLVWEDDDVAVSVVDAAVLRNTPSSISNLMKFTLVEPVCVDLAKVDFNTILQTRKDEAEVKLTFDKDYNNTEIVNPFSTNELMAEDASTETDAHGTHNFVYLYKKEADGTKSYLRVDTAYANGYGTKFLKFAFGSFKNNVNPGDATNGETIIPDQYQFRLNFCPMKDSLSIQVKSALYKLKDDGKPWSDVKNYGSEDADYVVTNWNDYVATHPSGLTDHYTNWVKLQDLELSTESRIITVGEAPINTHISFGFGGCSAVGTGMTSVADGVYYIIDKDGKYLASPIYENGEQAAHFVTVSDEQNPAHMPAYQWVVLTKYTQSKSKPTSPVVITNREFTGLQETIQLYENEGAQYMYIKNAINNASVVIPADSVQFVAVPQASVEDPYLGYKKLTKEELAVNKYTFNYWHPYADDKYIAQSANDSTLTVLTGKDAFRIDTIAANRIYPKTVDMAYGYDPEDAKTSDNKERIKGLAQLVRTVYYMTSTSSDNTWRINKEDKFNVGNDKNQQFIEFPVFFKENNQINDKCYHALVQANPVKIAGSVDQYDFQILDKDVNLKAGVSDYDAAATLKKQLLNETRTSAFYIAPDKTPLYRRFNSTLEGQAGDAVDTLRFYEKYRNEYLMIEANKNFMVEHIDFLGIDAQDKAQGGLAFIVDTAWVNRGFGNIKPQYLISIDRHDYQGVAGEPCTEAGPHIDESGHITDDPYECVHAHKAVPGFKRGKFLINFHRFANNDVMVNEDDYKWAEYDRAGFKEAIVYNDTLYVLRDEFKNLKNEEIDLAKIASAEVEAQRAYSKENGNLDGFLSYKYELAGDQHKYATWSMRFVDREKAKNEVEEDRAFLIESMNAFYNEVESQWIAPTYAAWLKMQNGCLVLSDEFTSAFDEVVTGGDDALIFNVEHVCGDKVAVDNENIAVEGVSVVAGNGQVTIMGAAGKNVTITNILGKVIASQVIASDNATIAVPAGIVAVAVEGEAAVKAIVK